MLRNVALKSLRDISRGFLWWSLGLIGFVALIVSVYPTVHSNPSLEKLSKEGGEAGRRKITQWTRYGTVVLSVVQGIGIAF